MRRLISTAVILIIAASPAVAGKVNATPAESPPDSRIAPIEANLLAANLAPL